MTEPDAGRRTEKHTSGAAVFVDGAEDFSSISSGFTFLAEGECAGLPLYERLCRGSAESRPVLRLLSQAPKGQRRPVLLFAAVHYLLLSDDAAGAEPHELARFYPTLGGNMDGTDDPFPIFESFLAERSAELSALIQTRGTQTNEVNRSCGWFASFRHIQSRTDRPLFAIEVGTSAGLNLSFDRYGYTFTRDNKPIFSDRPGAPVQLACDLRGPQAPPLDAPAPRMSGRVGIDISPISPSDTDAVRWLRACIWADQLDRMERFDGAIAEAQANLQDFVSGDGIEELRSVVDTCPEGSAIVVFHSWALSYIERSRRLELVELLTELSFEHQIFWLSAEAPKCVPGIEPPELPADASVEEHFATLISVSTFENGARSDEIVARCHPHLRWMEWLGTN